MYPRWKDCSSEHFLFNSYRFSPILDQIMYIIFEGFFSELNLLLHRRPEAPHRPNSHSAMPLPRFGQYSRSPAWDYQLDVHYLGFCVHQKRVESFGSGSQTWEVYTPSKTNGEFTPEAPWMIGNTFVCFLLDQRCHWQKQQRACQCVRCTFCTWDSWMIWSILAASHHGNFTAYDDEMCAVETESQLILINMSKEDDTEIDFRFGTISWAMALLA